MRKILACILICICACFSLTACERGNSVIEEPGTQEKDYVVTLVYNAPEGLPSQLGPTRIEINKGEMLNLPTYGTIEGGWLIESWQNEKGDVILSGIYNYDSDMELTAQWSWSSVRE